MKLEAETSLGPVWMWGDLTQFTGRPVLLIITGLFANENTLDHTAEFFRAHDVLRIHLPGNHCPSLAAISVGAWARAIDEAVEQHLSGRVRVVVGLSVGALVALALKTAGARRIVAVEPPIYTKNLWPLAQQFSTMTPHEAEILWPVLGIGRGPIEGRDYSRILESLSTPTIAILGGVPLMPPRPFSFIPSLVDDAAHALLEAHPMVRRAIVPEAGHNVPKHAPDKLRRAIEIACDEAGGYQLADGSWLP